AREMPERRFFLRSPLELQPRAFRLRPRLLLVHQRLPQLLGRPPPLRDVACESGEDEFRIGPELAERELERHFVSIAMKSRQLESAPLDVFLMRLHVPPQSVAMRRAIALGNDDVERFADQLARLPA